ncbi:MAG TPA: sulfotransferase [Thermoleophilaceae bacterium]
MFICGCPRSGTTLLGRLADAHPELAVVHESRFIADWYEKRVGLTPHGEVTPTLVSELARYPRYTRLGLGRDVLQRLLTADRPVSYDRFVSGIFDLYGEAVGKRIVGDKTPRYVRSLPTLHALWPEARFVHIIRDGRDVCLSVLNWGKGPTGRFSAWAEDPVSVVALWWRWHVLLGRQDGGALGGRLYHELRYESIVSAAERECAALCEFLGLAYDEAMLRFHEGRERGEPRLDAKKAWRPVTSGLRNWREQMPAADVERFEAAAGDVLAELGYARSVERPSAKARERAAKLKESFTRDVRARPRRLPERW